jgi:hypothetical protein
MEMSDFENTRYEGEERRQPRTMCPAAPSVSEAQISLMIEEEIERRMSKFEDRMLLHMDAKFAQMHKLISEAFPHGDPHGHRAYHELQIKQADGWDKIKGDILSKMLTGGIWLAAGYLALAVWNALKQDVTK